MVKQNWSKILSSLLLAIFVSFMFSNVIFMHLHRDASGHSILHSHPYSPKTSHNHSGNTLDLIAAFNLAAQTHQHAETPVFFAPQQTITTLDAEVVETLSEISTPAATLRGPPTSI